MIDASAILQLHLQTKPTKTPASNTQPLARLRLQGRAAAPAADTEPSDDAMVHICRDLRPLNGAPA
jgi:hypothetical protein